MAGSSIYVHKCALVADYLERKGIAKGQQKQEVAGGFALRVWGQSTWQYSNADKPLQLFAGKPKVLVSAALRHCISVGELSAKASDSRGD